MRTGNSGKQEPASAVIVGASGDLARRKVIPALFALFSQNLLPPHFRLFGFARTAMSHDAFRESISKHLLCRYVPGQRCAEMTADFLNRCFYTSGRYASPDSMIDLFQLMREREPTRRPNRLFYLAVPPSVFLDVARSIAAAGLVECGSDSPWSRVVVEKPFGRDRASSDLLVRELGGVFSEKHTYRIDHYLGKEVVQNLLVLRFGNSLFETVWRSGLIERIDIEWTENLSLAGRAGYFDEFGIIRDVVQNHLLQLLALVTMERPASLQANDVRNAKVAALKAVAPIESEDVVLGQYTHGETDGNPVPGYLEEEGVPAGSTAPTFFSGRFRILSERWKEAPIVITAGKGLASRKTEIRVRFRGTAPSLFPGVTDLSNDLTIRIQPDERIYLTLRSKEPGLNMNLVNTKLDLLYERDLSGIIHEAYESLLLDAFQGNKALFIHQDELSAAWDIVTPLLHSTEASGKRPAPYPFGGAPPALHA